MKRWRADPTEENFWGVVVAYAGMDDPARFASDFRVRSPARSAKVF